MNIFNPKPIGESELIITGRGTIYHIDLAPENLADTVILVGDPDRVKEVVKYFDHIEHSSYHREFISKTGYIGKKHLTVLSTGIGTDNIDIVINELDALVNIDFTSRLPKDQKKNLSIIRLGTAGSLQQDIAVDSLVVSSFGIGLDNLMHYYKFENNTEELYIINEFNLHTGLREKSIFPYIAEGSIRLRKHFTEGYHHGITATCPGFYGPQARSLRSGTAFPNLIDALSSFNSRQHRIVNFEMETSGIYGLSNLLGHHSVSISTIVANRKQNAFTKDVNVAIDLMIRKSLELIEHI